MRRSFPYLLAIALIAVLLPSRLFATRDTGRDGAPDARPAETQAWYAASRGRVELPTSPAFRRSQAARVDLTGHWVRNDARSDAGYWMREYPGMTLDIAQEGNTLVVRQALGRVRDGVAEPGSGSEHHEYTLIADGQAREVAGPPPVRRTVTAAWIDDGLRAESVWHLDAADDGIDVPVTETWRIIDGGATLEIRRETRMPGRPVGDDVIVFDRQR